LVSGIVDDAGQFLVGELLAAEPLPRPSHRVVEEAVVGNRWPLGVDDREAVARRRHDPLRASEHLQVDHFHEHRSMASSTAIGPSDRVSGLTSGLHFARRTQMLQGVVAAGQALLSGVWPVSKMTEPFASPRKDRLVRGATIMSRKKVSRNAPCPCGSGKKYKHCCYNKGF